MTAQKGKDLLLKLDENANGTFITVAGLRSRSISLNAETVDTTHAESAGRWRELLSGAGVKRASISGSGIFRDDSADISVKTLFFDGTIRPWRVIVPSFGTIEAQFQITELRYAGDHDNAVTFEIALQSAGELTFTAL